METSVQEPILWGRRIRGPCLSFCWLTALVVAPGCQEEPQGSISTPAVSTTDSAGVRIVHSHEPAWDEDAPPWSLSQERVLEVGTTDGDEAQVLHDVRAAIRLTDGGVAVANRGISLIRIYGPDGEHLRDLGGDGDGPGEFRLLNDLWRGAGDSLVAGDNRLQRVTVFGPDGGVGRSIALRTPDEAGQLFPLGPLGEEGLLVAATVPPREPPQEGLFDGGARTLYHYSEEGNPEHALRELPHPPYWGISYQGDIAFTSAPFSVHPPPYTLHGNSVYLATGETFEIEQRNAQGNLIRIIRWAGQGRSVTPELADRFREERLEGVDSPETRRFVEAMLDGIAFPDELPAFQSLQVDADGYLWVERYRVPWEAEGAWWVFSPEGEWLGVPPVPADLEVLEVGTDYLLGLRRDEFDVERVVKYPLDRGR